jgi:hypothetical protein
MGDHPTPWRVGSKGRQTIYDASPDGDGGQPGRSLGRMDTPELAARVVVAVNEHVALRAELLRLLSLYDNDGTLVIEAGEGADAACWHLALAADYPAIAAALRVAGG